MPAIPQLQPTLRAPGTEDLIRKNCRTVRTRVGVSAVEDILQVALLVGVLQVDGLRVDGLRVEALLVDSLPADDLLVEALRGVLRVDVPRVEVLLEVPP